MKCIETEIDGVIIIEHNVINDSRGYFFESFKKSFFDEKIGSIIFVQENESCSSKFVVRGLHYQNPPYSQAKLVSCVRGRIISLALDLRVGRSTYGKCLQTELSEANKLSEFIPHGFAHGFISLEENSIVQYKCDDYYKREEMRGINVLDPSLDVVFPFGIGNAVVSDADKVHPFLKDIDSPFK